MAGLLAGMVTPSPAARLRIKLGARRHFLAGEEETGSRHALTIERKIAWLVAGGWLDLGMIKPVPLSLQTETNAPVLAWLADKSAHDEVASALVGATRALGDVVTYCPDPKQFRYVVTATRGTIFGVAEGMSSVSFRLDPTFHARALQHGATEAPALGPAWASFTLFRSDWPQPDLPFWAMKAYCALREG